MDCEDKAVEENVEEVETEPNDSNIAHKVPKTEEEEVEKEGDTSMASHKLSEVEPESEFLSLPASLASHLLLPVEWTEADEAALAAVTASPGSAESTPIAH